MRRSSLIGPAVALLSAAGTAAAQEAPAPAAAPSRDKAAVTFNEVERGVYLGASAGPLFILNPPAASGSPRPFSPGQMAQVEVGVDFGDRLSVGLFLTGSANKESASYVGSSGGTASGDFGMLIPGATVRLNLLGFADSQGTTRTYLYLRGGAGYVFYGPVELLSGVTDVLAFGAAGVEYYTRLRHFSIGLEVSGAFLVPSSTIGFAVTPSLRYAF
jgi:hypothetical protein